MIGVDTNVLLRYFLYDNPEQAERAARELTAGERFFVNMIVLCEVAWVLETGYGFSRDTLCDAIDKILAAAEFEVENKDLVLAALEDFRTSKADFADCLIGRRNRSAGCAETITFDRDLKGLRSFRLLS